MAKKLKLINLPTNVADLRTLLDAFKDKEIKLEADLCIRDNPDLEGMIIRIMLCIADIKNTENSLKISGIRSEVSAEKIASIDKMLAFYARKIEMFEKSTSDRRHEMMKFYSDKIQVYEDNRKMVEKGYGEKYLEINEKRMESIIILKDETKKAQRILKDLDVIKVIPALQDYQEYLTSEKTDE